jgi:hypothetical protein
MIKRLPLFIVIFSLVLAGFILPAAARTWKSSSGRFSVEAELIDFKEGKAQLKKADGTLIEVPLVSLSEEDRRFVKGRFPGVQEEKLTPGAEYREWSSKSGKFSAIAEFLGVEEGKVQLRKPDGSEISVDKKLLSPADQGWIASELKRQREEEKENKSAPNTADEEVAGKIEAQEVPMKLVRMDPPKGKGRGKANVPVSYIFTLTEPQQVYFKLGSAAGKSDGKGESASQAEFARIITHEPVYHSANPLRGVVQFGDHRYGFAIDSAGGKVAGYNRLYFDFNGNGDLTDDKPVAAVSSGAQSGGMAITQFPRIDVKVDAGGKSYEASFLPSVISRQTPGDSYATATFYAASVREGHIERGSKHINLLLVDHNSNGRFDDAVSVRSNGDALEGDLLLVNPKAKKRVSSDAELDRDRNFINKTVCIGKEFYRIELPASGETLKLTPAKISLGSVSNSSPAFRAVLFCEDYGVIAIGRAKDSKIPLPEGAWKVLRYSIEGGNGTIVSALFGSESPPVTVAKGATARLPFGAPFHAAVTAARTSPQQVALSLSILGVGGERCTSLTIQGKKPPNPLFVIKDKNDKVVRQGVFEFG